MLTRMKSCTHMWTIALPFPNARMHKPCHSSFPSTWMQQHPPWPYINSGLSVFCVCQWRYIYYSFHTCVSHFSSWGYLSTWTSSGLAEMRLPAALMFLSALLLGQQLSLGEALRIAAFNLHRLSPDKLNPRNANNIKGPLSQVKLHGKVHGAGLLMIIYIIYTLLLCGKYMQYYIYVTTPSSFCSIAIIQYKMAHIMYYVHYVC